MTIGREEEKVRGLDNEAALHTWATRIEAMVSAGEVAFIDRVLVLASTGSTQDAARQYAAGGGALWPGVAVLAGVQTAGRGRLGRAWSDARGLGLAMTLAIDAAAIRGMGVEALPLAIGLAVCRACEGAIGRKHVVGLRWPNDVVERGRGVGSGGRKVAGALIERESRGDQEMLLIGVGVNVGQGRGDFPAEIRDRAASLRMLASEGADEVSRLDAACGVLREVQRVLGMEAGELRRAWMKRDVLVGTRRTFIHGGKAVTGTVEGIDPMSRILVRTNLGNVVSLPALSTSMVHD